MTYVVTTILLNIPVVLFVYWIGIVRGRAEERAKKPEPIKPVCPCNHTWGSHKEGNRCQAQEKRENYNKFGERSGWEYANCACTKYHGPVVVTEEFFHPGVITQ